MVSMEMRIKKEEAFLKWFHAQKVKKNRKRPACSFSPVLLSFSLSLPFFPSLLDKQQKITNIRRSRVSRTFRFTLFYFFKTPKMHLLFFSSFHVFALKIFQPTITQRIRRRKETRVGTWIGN
jgi:hypothetical protein